jgi:membrane protein required for colicin V production
MIEATIAIIDILIIIVFSFFIYRGYNNGFVPEFMRAIGTFIGLVLATRYMSNLAIAIYGATNVSPMLITIICFVIIFTVVVLGFRYLSAKFLTAVKFSMTLGQMDRLAGIAFGLAKGAIVVSLCTVLISFATFSTPIRNEIRQSMLFNPMRNILPLAYSVAKLFFRDNYLPFYRELEESFSGQTEERRGEAQDLIDYYRPK